MSVNLNAAAQNLFKSRCPRRACCPIHETAVCVKYIQPPRPLSCKPVVQYCGPEYPLEGNTIYHESYQGVDADVARDCRPPAVLTRGNISLPCEPFADATTMGLSYAWSWQPPPEPFRPRAGPAPPCGPMQNTTTQRHDFPAKPSMRCDKIVPQGNMALIDAKMEDRTVAMESYMPVGRPEPPLSCKPLRTYQTPEFPLESSTVTQASYLPPEMPAREIPPWVPRNEYIMPDTRMAGDTIYNGSFLAPGNFEPCDLNEAPPCRAVCVCEFPTATEDL